MVDLGNLHAHNLCIAGLPRAQQEYEVACQFRMVSMKVQKEKVYRWSVWKRYSEFARLDAYVDLLLAFSRFRIAT